MRQLEHACGTNGLELRHKCFLVKIRVDFRPTAQFISKFNQCNFYILSENYPDWKCHFTISK